MPPKEEPSSSGFVAYPRPGKVVRKNPNSIPLDRWLAGVGGVVAIASFVSSTTRISAYRDIIWVIWIATLVLMLSACHVVSRGNRGFRIVVALGLLQAWAMYIEWGRGDFFQASWFAQVIHAYTGFLAVYCAARYFGFGRRQ